MDLIDKIISFEQEDLSDTEIVELFQNLLDTGLVWELQGSYGRMAVSLIDQGYITQKEV